MDSLNRELNMLGDYVKSEAVMADAAKLTNDLEDLLREKVKAVEKVLYDNDLLSFKYIILNDLQLLLLDRKRD
jgi:hypothetical protein